MNRLLSVGVVVVALAGSALIWQRLPARSDIYAPFDVAGPAGELVSGRNVAVTVNGVRIAATAQIDSVLTPAPVAAVGSWVVVDAAVQPGEVADAVHADLVLGPDTYAPTDRLPSGTVLGGIVQPGIRTHGSWLFDVANARVDDNSPMSLRVWVGDGRWDSRLVVDLSPEATQVSRVASAEVPRPRQDAS